MTNITTLRPGEHFIFKNSECRKEGRYGSPQMAAHSKRKPPKVSINGVLKIADKDGTTYGKAVLAHNI